MPFQITQPLLNTREFILERNPIYVNNVEKSFLGLIASISTRLFILERNPISVKSVGKVFSDLHPLEDIKGFILNRNLTCMCKVMKSC